MTFMEELQEEKHHVGDAANTWKKVLCSDEINNFLTLCYMLLNTPSSIMLGGGGFLSSAGDRGAGQSCWEEAWR